MHLEKRQRSNNQVIKLLFSTRLFRFCLADDAFSSMCKNSAALPQHQEVSFTGPPPLASCSRGSCLSISSKALLHERYDFGLQVLGFSDMSQLLEHNLQATIHPWFGLSAQYQSSAARIVPSKTKRKVIIYHYSVIPFIIHYIFRLLSLMSWMKVNCMRNANEHSKPKRNQLATMKLQDWSALSRTKDAAHPERGSCKQWPF